MNTNIHKNVQLVLRLYSLSSFSLIQSDWVIQHYVFNKISMHVCVDDCPFINRIELKLIFLDYKGNLWYVRYVKIGISSYVVLDYLQVFAEVALVRFFTTVCRQVSTQITSFRGVIVAKIAFVALFANVNFQRNFQITKSGRCKVTLVEVVWFLINMYIKNIGPRASKVTLVSVIRLITIIYSYVYYQITLVMTCNFCIAKSRWLLLFAVPQNIWYKITSIAFVRFYPEYSHRWHLLGFSPMCVFIWVRIDAKSEKL